MDPADAKLAESLAARNREHGGATPDEEVRRPGEAGTDATGEGTLVGWLGLLCGLIEGTSRGVVLMRSDRTGTDGWQAVASWPDADGDFTRLATVAEGAYDKQRTVVRPHPRSQDAAAADTHDVAHPLMADTQITGVVALEVSDCPEPRLPEVVRQLQSAASYFPMLLTAPSVATRAPRSDVLEAALWLVGSCLEHQRFRGAATAVATDMAAQFGCDRVSIGFVKGKQIKVHALSHSADFGERMNLIRRIGGAMDEAVDQRTSIALPTPPDAPLLGVSAHEELLKEANAVACCTVLLTWNEDIIGAVTLERSTPFGSAEIATLEDTATLLGPILELKRRDDRWLVQKAWDTLRDYAGQLIGPGHMALKAAAVGVVLAVLYLSFATGTFRVTADATLEGAVTRVAVAPIDGFIVQAPARAGDLVHTGDVLAVLDDRDLLLQRRNLQSQRDQIESEYLEAMAEQERVDMNLLATRMEQADAQLSLIEEQLARLTIVAPIDGVVVSGDLSQSIGAPVQQGDSLYEVAPLDSYRLMLRVDEHDIAYVHPQQRGAVVLTALPGSTHDFTVEKVTPVSTSEEGTSYFLVEASLDDADPVLRPGMEGVGKVDISRERRLWIVTRRFNDWARLWLWSWWGPES
ncbi:MAG: HlyD family efflux transporter periplasmic adaptor subunit [Acidobacteriota bacterium]